MNEWTKKKIRIEFGHVMHSMIPILYLWMYSIQSISLSLCVSDKMYHSFILYVVYTYGCISTSLYIYFFAMFDFTMQNRKKYVFTDFFFVAVFLSTFLYQFLLVFELVWIEFVDYVQNPIRNHLSECWKSNKAETKTKPDREKKLTIQKNNLIKKGDRQKKIF